MLGGEQQDEVRLKFGLGKVQMQQSPLAATFPRPFSRLQQTQAWISPSRSLPKHLGLVFFKSYHSYLRHTCSRRQDSIIERHGGWLDQRRRPIFHPRRPRGPLAHKRPRFQFPNFHVDYQLQALRHHQRKGAHLSLSDLQRLTELPTTLVARPR
jgi:hypothetical protein